MDKSEKLLESQIRSEAFCKLIEIVDICSAEIDNSSDTPGNVQLQERMCSNTTKNMDSSTLNLPIILSNSETKSPINNSECEVNENERNCLDEMIVEKIEESDSLNETTTSSCPTYTEPIYNFNIAPKEATGAWKDFAANSNFLKGCKWAPDGTCLLTNSDDHTLRIFNLPEAFYRSNVDWTEFVEMTSVLKIPESELIYDYCWYPKMSSSDYLSCCLLSTSRQNPVHLWDAFTGHLRCTYRPYNHVGEVVAAYSIAFNPTADKIYCGFDKMIRVFDVSCPGCDFNEIPTNADKKGQSGIISSLAFGDGVFAAGSYNKSIGIYSEKGDLVALICGQQGGVTLLQFSPDGRYLYSGGRKDPEILCWDMRNFGEVCFSLRRIVTTNQRIHFDVSQSGKYVVSGNQNGIVTFWDTTKPPVDVSFTKEPVLEPSSFFEAHKDCVNGVSFHPILPLLASSSGQRKFPEPVDTDSSDSEEELFSTKCLTQDNSLRLWWLQ